MHFRNIIKLGILTIHVLGGGFAFGFQAPPRKLFYKYFGYCIHKMDATGSGFGIYRVWVRILDFDSIGFGFQILIVSGLGSGTLYTPNI